MSTSSADFAAQQGGGHDYSSQPSGAKVYVIIPVHNRWRYTRACLDSLLRQSCERVTLIVVDDGSSDETRRALQTDYPDVVVLEGDGELWWTGSVNLGIQWALSFASDGDYVLTLNNDTTVEPDYVARLLQAARAFPRALVGSVAVDSGDRDTIADGGSTINWLTGKTGRMNAGRSLRSCLKSGTEYVVPDMLSGRGTLIPVACLRECGLFDAERLPQYAADNEFSVRASRAGYLLRVSYIAPVYSVVEATGTVTRFGRIAWRSWFAMFWSRRSPSCLLYRWRFARLAAPKRYLCVFLVTDTARVIIGSLRDQLSARRSPNG